MRIIYLVIASNDPIHEYDLKTQQETWVARLPQNQKVIWLRGHHKDFYDYQDRTLFVPCEEFYENILEKTILGVSYIVNNFEFDVLIRTNVSTYFDPEKLEKELNKKRYLTKFVGGYFDKTNGGYFGALRPFNYISGTGIFMSHAAAQFLASLNFSSYRGIPDDVAISEYFIRNEFTLIKMLRNNLSSTHIFLPSYYTRAKSSIISLAASKRMKLLDAFFRAPSPTSRLKASMSIYLEEFRFLTSDPEGFLKYLQRNRVVFQSYINTRFEQLWSLIIQR